jgi:hypothetical protein
MLNAYHERMTALLGNTEASLECKEPKSNKMESGAEDATVNSSGMMKKRHRGQHIAAGQCGQTKKLTRRDCGSWGMLVAACKKMSHQAAVAWHRRNVFRNIRTQGNCGSWQELSTTGIMITCHKGVAHCKGHGCKRQITEAVRKGTQNGQIDKKRRWKYPGCKNGIRDPNFKEQPHMRCERITSENYRKTIWLDFVKQATEMSTRFLKMWNWTLWRGRTPPKRKNLLALLA